MSYEELAEVLVEADPALVDVIPWMGIERFDSLINALLPLIDVGKSPLTNKRYKGFAVNGAWFAKVEIE